MASTGLCTSRQIRTSGNRQSLIDVSTGRASRIPCVLNICPWYTGKTMSCAGYSISTYVILTTIAHMQVSILFCVHRIGTCICFITCTLVLTVGRYLVGTFMCSRSKVLIEYSSQTLYKTMLQAQVRGCGQAMKQPRKSRTAHTEQTTGPNHCLELIARHL